MIRECRENATGNLYMAKIVPYEPESKQAVLQEYDILKSLHHEKVMALHEAYVTPRYLVLISECCSGKELLYSLIDRSETAEYLSMSFSIPQSIIFKYYFTFLQHHEVYEIYLLLWCSYMYNWSRF